MERSAIGSSVQRDMRPEQCRLEQDGRGEGSEDCLYLNVWTPAWPAKTKQAVMVWLGGGDTGGPALGAGESSRRLTVQACRAMG